MDAKWLSRDLEKYKGYDRYSLYRYLYNNSISNADHLGATKLIKRSLLFHKDTTCRTSYISVRMTDISPDVGWKTYHSHFVFDDGSDIGYFDDGELKADPEGLFMAIDVRVGLDDTTLREAIKLTPPKPYSFHRISIAFVFGGRLFANLYRM